LPDQLADSQSHSAQKVKKFWENPLGSGFQLQLNTQYLYRDKLPAIPHQTHTLAAFAVITQSGVVEIGQAADGTHFHDPAVVDDESGTILGQGLS
jgi:hypothetical protein